MSYLEAAIPSLTLVIFPRAGMGVTHGGLLFRSTIKYHENDGMNKFAKHCDEVVTEDIKMPPKTVSRFMGNICL